MDLWMTPYSFIDFWYDLLSLVSNISYDCFNMFLSFLSYVQCGLFKCVSGSIVPFLWNVTIAARPTNYELLLITSHIPVGLTSGFLFKGISLLQSKVSKETSLLQFLFEQIFCVTLYSKAFVYHIYLSKT